MTPAGGMDTVFRLMDGALRLPEAERDAWVAGHAPSEAARREAIAMLAFVTTETVPASTAAGPSLAATAIGDFEVLRPIGCGAGGIVYEAMQRMPRRRVALKVLRVSGESANERLAAEAQALAHVAHPSIAAIHAAGVAQVGGAHAAWIAMELVDEARSATERAAELRGERSAVARLAACFAEAIGAAHRAGILHRDIKPANLLVDRAGNAKVVDFGIAVPAGAGAAPAGTPAYMAPECLGGAPATESSDIWSLGAVMQAMFDAAGIDRGDRLRGVPGKAMARDPSGRYAVAETMAEDLLSLLDGRPASFEHTGLFGRLWLRARRRPKAAALAAVATIAVAAVLAVAALNVMRTQAQGLHDARRMLGMHGELVASIDSLPPSERPAAADRAMERGRLAFMGQFKDAEVAFLSIASLLRLGAGDRACELADAAARAMKAPGGPSDHDLLWIRLMDSACKARAAPDDGAALADLAARCESIGATSMGDDLLLASYLNASAVESGDGGFADLAVRLDAGANAEPSRALWRTMLAMVAMSVPREQPVPSGRGPLVAQGMERAFRTVAREELAIIFTNLGVAGMLSAARERDIPRFRVLVPLARAAAAATASPTYRIWVEQSIGQDLLGLGDIQGAARILDEVAAHPDLARADDAMVTFWLPSRVRAALRMPDAAAQLRTAEACFRAAPKLAAGDALLASWVEAVNAERLDDASRLLADWCERQRKRRPGDLRDQRIELCDELRVHLGERAPLELPKR